MTKRREAMTYEATVTLIADAIGWERAASICGVTERSVRNWSDPDSPIQIRLMDAEKLDKAYILAGGDHAPFGRLMASRLAASDAPANLPPLPEVAAKAARACGASVATLIAIAHGSRDRAKHRQFLHETEEALGALMTAISVLDAQAEQEGERK